MDPSIGYGFGRSMSKVSFLGRLSLSRNPVLTNTKIQSWFLGSEASCVPRDPFLVFLLSSRRGSRLPGDSWSLGILFVTTTSTSSSDDGLPRMLPEQCWWLIRHGRSRLN